MIEVPTKFKLPPTDDKFPRDSIGVPYKFKSPPTDVKFPRDSIGVPPKFKLPPTDVKFPRDSIEVLYNSKLPIIEYFGFPFLFKYSCKEFQSLLKYDKSGNSRIFSSCANLSYWSSVIMYFIMINTMISQKEV